MWKGNDSLQLIPEHWKGVRKLRTPRRNHDGTIGFQLQELLTGQPPFTGADTQEVLRKVQEEEPIPPHRLWAEVPPALQTACLRALAKKAADRYASAAALAQEVQLWQEVQRRAAEEALRKQKSMLQ